MARARVLAGLTVSLDGFFQDADGTPVRSTPIRIPTPTPTSGRRPSSW